MKNWVVKYYDGEYDSYLHVRARSIKVNIIDGMLVVTMGRTIVQVSCDPSGGFEIIPK